MSLIYSTSIHAQELPRSVEGPVFEHMGSVYDLEDVDFKPDSNQVLYAIFDIERLQEDPEQINPLITSLHRYYNMHVRNGVMERNIHLAFVVHGSSSKDVLTHAAYRKRYGVENPNLKFISALEKKGVDMFICGQSASYAGIHRDEIVPQVQFALSAMTVLTMYQMNGYALIRF